MQALTGLWWNIRASMIMSNKARDFQDRHGLAKKIIYVDKVMLIKGEESGGRLIEGDRALIDVLDNGKLTFSRSCDLESHGT